MTFKRIKIKTGFLFLICHLQLSAQPVGDPPEKPIDFHQFINTVTIQNIGYAAEKYQVEIAELRVQTAGMRPDPELNLEGTNIGEPDLQLGYEFGGNLGWILELGGKRRARIELAKSETELSESLMKSYFNNLRAEAATAFLTSIRNKTRYELLQEAYKQLQDIARSDSLRYQLGEISLITVRQSKLELQFLFNQGLQAESDWKMSLTSLEMLMNVHVKDSLLSPSGNFKKFDREFNLQDLITTARNNHSDLMVALHNKEVASRIVNLEKANRKIDLDLNAGVYHATQAQNKIAPSPPHNPVSAGISIPLKFSNKRNADLKSAKLDYQHKDFLYAKVEKEITQDVIQAFEQYNSYRKQLNQYDDGMLTEATEILKGTTIRYNQGEISLQDLLDAQKNHFKVKSTYVDLLYNKAAALVELERATGIWDIDF